MYPISWYKTLFAALQAKLRFVKLGDSRQGMGADQSLTTIVKIHKETKRGNSRDDALKTFPDMVLQIKHLIQCVHFPLNTLGVDFAFA